MTGSKTGATRRRSARRYAWVTSLGLMLAGAAVVMAAPGVVRTKSGTTFEGNVTEKADAVVVNVRGIDTTIPRAEIESLEYGTFDEIWNKRFAALDAKDVAGRIQLARQAYDGKHYPLADRALTEAIALEPNNAEANQLLTLVRNQQRLQPAPGNDTGANRPPATPADAPPTTPRPERNLLSPEDINAIRLMELTQQDNVPVRIDAQLRRRFTEQQNIKVADFQRLGGVEQALAILDKAPDMAREVKVNRDPASMAEFRRVVQPLVLAGCAAVGCHGGPNAGKFMLINPSTDDATAYTNFYILTQYKLAAAQPQPGQTSGIFGKGDSGGGLITRGQGDRSGLVQLGLPQSIAEVDHPEVRGYQPIFRNREDPRYRQVVQWMNNSLKPIEPNYGITYTLPTGNPPATQPAPK
jgi:hypothetical protein